MYEEYCHFGRDIILTEVCRRFGITYCHIQDLRINQASIEASSLHEDDRL
jgi:hypothetical protein